jgi:predicted RNA-binding Zn-ribbon protein involved in translation (DUF1610 family)
MDEKATKVFRSLIRRRIPRDLYQELLKMTFMYDVNNNVKGYELKRLLTEYGVPYSSLGSGTNRFGILIDGYAVKFALDPDGMIDNKREFLYSEMLYPSAVRVYECSDDGLIAVTEYVELFNLDAFYQYSNEMRRILGKIAESFLVGDVGVTAKNYINWGIRHTSHGDEICMLDFAYIYSVKYGIFKCTCDDETFLEYDKDFVNFTCPRCGKKYTFGEVRRKVTRSAQDKEIGDIKRLGYVLNAPEVELAINPKFTKFGKDKKKKQLKGAKLARKLQEAEQKQAELLQDCFDYNITEEED